MDSESLANLYVEDRKLLFSSLPADYSFQHLKLLKGKQSHLKSLQMISTIDS